MSVSMTACFAATWPNSQGAVFDARAFGNTNTWSQNPWKNCTNGGGGSCPNSGTVLLPGGNITVNQPVVPPDYYSLIGVAPRPYTSQSGTVFVASATNFPATYSTGTVTMGTAGQGEVITGVSTVWTTNVKPGCIFNAPATEPTPTISTWGVIVTVTDNTHITLGTGANNSGGAPAGGGNYKIYCPAGLLGDGNVAGTAEYGMKLTNIAFDGNNVAPIALANYYCQQYCGTDGVFLRGFTGIGFDYEGTNVYDSGPWTNIQSGTVAAGATSSTVDYVIRPGGGMHYGFWFLGSGGGTNTVGIAIDGGDVELNGLDTEMTAASNIGISIGAKLSCVPACVYAPTAPSVVSIKNVYQLGGAEAIHIATTDGTPSNIELSQINSGGTYNVVDDLNGCSSPTATEAKLNHYATNNSGGIGESTSIVSGCGAITSPANKLFLASEYTNSTTTPTNIFGSSTLYAAISQNSYMKYIIHCHGQWKAATGGAFELTVTGPASATADTYTFHICNTISSAACTYLDYVSGGNGLPSGINTTAVGTAATYMPFDFDLSYYNTTNAGAITIEANTISTDTLTILRGSYCTMQ